MVHVFERYFQVQCAMLLEIELCISRFVFAYLVTKYNSDRSQYEEVSRNYKCGLMCCFHLHQAALSRAVGIALKQCSNFQ